MPLSTTKPNMTVRVARKDGGWEPLLNCVVTERVPGISATVYVPRWRGEWIVCPQGMVANIGGNDWRIYTIHPEDCAALCAGEVVAP